MASASTARGLTRGYVMKFFTSPMLTGLNTTVLTRRCFASYLKEAKLMRKIVSRGSSRKRKWYPEPVRFDYDPSASSQKPRRSARTDRTSVVIANHIMDVVNSGELSSEINESNVEISEIKVMPDLSGINVYWVATGTEKDEKIKTLLSNNSKKLRYHLIQHQVMGNVPEINFVMDRRKSHVLEVERLLKIADFGPDYQPSTLHERWKDYETNRNSVHVKSTESENSVTSDRVASSRSKVLNMDNSGFIDVGDNMNKDPSESHRNTINSIESNSTDIQDNLKSRFRSDVYGLDRELLVTRIHKSKDMLSSRSKRNVSVPSDDIIDKSKKSLYQNSQRNLRGSLKYNMTETLDEIYEDEESFGDEMKVEDEEIYMCGSEYDDDYTERESSVLKDHSDDELDSHDSSDYNNLDK